MSHDSHRFHALPGHRHRTTQVVTLVIVLLALVVLVVLALMHLAGWQ